MPKAVLFNMADTSKRKSHRAVEPLKSNEYKLIGDLSKNAFCVSKTLMGREYKMFQ